MSSIVVFLFLFLCFRFVPSSLVCTPSSSSYLHFSSLYQVCISFLILILIHRTFSILVYNKCTAHLSIRFNLSFLLIFVSSCSEYFCIYVALHYMFSFFQIRAICLIPALFQIFQMLCAPVLLRNYHLQDHHLGITLRCLTWNLHMIPQK